MAAEASAGPGQSRAVTAEAICARFDLPRSARPLLREGIGPRAFFAALMAEAHYLAGIDFLAHAIVARDAVWWGALCLQHAFGGALVAEDRAAAIAALRWVLQPTETHRAATREPADAAGPASAAGALAMAVCQTGGSVVPPPAPPRPHPPYAPARAVGTAIRLATLKAQPADMPQTQRIYAELGLSIAQGRCPIPDLAGAYDRRRA